VIRWEAIGLIFRGFASSQGRLNHVVIEEDVVKTWSRYRSVENSLDSMRLANTAH
jgi:hypothetical protein